MSEQTNNPTPSENTPQTENPYLSRKKTHKRILKILWFSILSGILCVVLLFSYLSTQLPSFEELENPRSKIASEVYSSDGVLLGKYYLENRTPVHYDSLSPFLVDALISTEDARFKQHSGIDARAIIRVIVKTIILRQDNAGGGSTISQQLAKLLVGRPDTRGMSSTTRAFTLGTTKFKEWLTAVKLERAYTKEEIIALYFNQFDFLFRANGIKSAAEIYFAKQPNTLSVNEAATLVRMLKNPALYNPRLNYQNAFDGRNQVLYEMKKQGKLSEEEYNTLKEKPIDLSKFQMKDHNDGLAPYFRMYLRDYVKNLLKKQGQNKDKKLYDIYKDGLKIYTTIDSRMQKHAEAAALAHLKKHQAKLFKHWKNWNHPNPTPSNRGRNPWVYKTSSKTTDTELALRQLQLYRLIWNSDRYKHARKQLLPTGIKAKLEDSDIHNLLRLDRANNKPKKDKDSKKLITGEVMLANWESKKKISKKGAKLYRKVINGKDWSTIKKEYLALIDYMKKPVKMQIFSHNAADFEIDTTMSPFDSVRYLRMHLQTGMMAVHPRTGQVKAWVGGINFKYFQYDHVNTVAKRQVGSTMKPFLYGVAIEQQGYSPCHKVYDSKTTIEKGTFGLIRDWSPKNAGGKYSDTEITITEALKKSLNSVSAKLMKDLGSVDPLLGYLYDIGIDTSKIVHSPTICLGSPDLSVFEMTGGYTPFANNGIYTQPIFIDRIEDKNGEIIYNGMSEQVQKRVLKQSSAFVMNQMLKTVAKGMGGFRGIRSKFGGKTGTTNFQSDGWFMGITPELIVGTWVGCDDRFIRFRGLTNGQGGHMARPIFQNFLRNLEGDKESGYDYLGEEINFPRPSIIDVEMDCIQYDKFNTTVEESTQLDFTDEEDTEEDNDWSF